MSGSIWENYPATAHQQETLAAMLPPTPPPGAPPSAPPPPGDGGKRQSQADLLLALLRARRAEGKPLDLPEIRNLGVYQHTARIHTLRHVRGMVIDNERERMPDGSVHSRYWLRHDCELDGAQ